MSAGKTGLGRIVPGRQGGPRRQRRFDTPFVLGLTLGFLINLALLLALFFRANPEAMPAGPQAIPVDLVQEPKPAPQPKAEDNKDAEKEAQQAKIHTKYKSSGGDSQDLPQGTAETGAPDTAAKFKQPEKQVEQADKQAKASETHEEPIGPLPAWARHLTQGYGASQARRGTNASGPVGGGNLYLNRMRDKIKAAITGMGVPTPRHPGEYSIILTRRGQVVDVKLVKSSGLKAFDDAGYAAIIRAGPYGPLPPGVVGDYVEVTFTFTPE